MAKTKIFVQIPDGKSSWENIKHEVIETSNEQAVRDTLSVVAKLLGKTIRISYPTSLSDNATSLNGHYIN